MHLFITQCLCSRVLCIKIGYRMYAVFIFKVTSLFLFLIYYPVKLVNQRARVDPCVLLRLRKQFFGFGHKTRITWPRGKRSWFCSQQAEVDRNIELLKKKDEELSEALEKMENQTENNDIDDIIVPTAPLYKQILNLYAEENAIEDTIFYLGEALRRGVIDLEVFLKVRGNTAPPPSCHNV